MHACIGNQNNASLQLIFHSGDLRKTSKERERDGWKKVTSRTPPLEYLSTRRNVLVLCPLALAAPPPRTSEAGGDGQEHASAGEHGMDRGRWEGDTD